MTTDRWQDLRACASMSPVVFYPTATRPDIRTAQAVCAMCPVKRECKDAEFRWAAGDLGHGNWSICGYRAGMTEKARRTAYREWCAEQGLTVKNGKSVEALQRQLAKQSASQGLKRRLRRQEILTVRREEAAA